MSGGQVGALLALRWRMVRSPVARIGLLLVLLTAVGLLLAAAVGGAGVPLGRVTGDDIAAGDFIGGAVDRTEEVRVLLPSALLAFLLLAIVAPIAAGGGYELIPESHLVAYPIRVATLVRGSLLLTPLNVAWYVQVVVLGLATSYAVRGPGGPTIPLLVVAAFLLAATAVGQVIGWVLVGVRRTRRGRLATWAAVGLLGAAAVWTVATDRVQAALDAAPTRSVLTAAERGAALDTGGWAPVVAVLLVATALAYLGAVRAADWALRRPGDLGSDGPLSRPVDRRAEAPSVYRALVRADRASVWRSPPLRRGVLVLAVLPVAAAVVAGLPWSSIALLPPLIASGSALLFGVNALSLDGSGALWVASLPHDPAEVLRAKARVVAEVVLGGVGIVLLGSALRATTPLSGQAALAVLGSAVACSALVIATCLRLSVTRPHRAELRSPRDTPAPPGTMALYSVRLAAVTTLVGLVFSVSTVARSAWLPIVTTAVCLAWAAWSWSRTRRIWADPVRRAHVVATVAAG
jgi:hypothetical protein